MHAFSEVLAPLPPSHARDLRWSGLALEQMVISETHVGTFTPEGTFDAIIPRRELLEAVGFTAVELMPVAQFPGSRNWGYDGVNLFAAHSAYGGAAGLRRLADACHARGLALILDVVYNHLGPEGNYLPEFGPYFTDRYSTPWGKAINFDQQGSDEVRRFFIENALWWVRDCAVDALRLDAVHAIADTSATPFVEELCAAVRREGERFGRKTLCIAESADNNARLITPVEAGGMGAEAQWNDDFHHALRVALTGERAGYFVDYRSVDDLAKCFMQGYAYTGQHSVFRGRRHGRPSRHLLGERFVVCAQNHDQIGNRPMGDRLVSSVGIRGAKVAAAATILSPFVPLLFMGEEHAESAPFLYFISHTDEGLVEAVRRGRAAEFAEFFAAGEAPDPQSPETFNRSRIDWSLRQKHPNRGVLDWHRDLLALRRHTPAFSCLDTSRVDAQADDQSRTLSVRRWAPDAVPGVAPGEAWILLAFADAPTTARVPRGTWRVVADSEHPRYAGSSPQTEGALHAGAEVRLSGPAALVCLREV